jgi:peroxiredoxin
MAQIKVGQAAPPVNLESIDGKKVSLAEYWQDGRSTLLIFLRHLA